MPIPRELLRMVRRGFCAKANVLKHGGKNFPPKHSDIYGIYKRLKQAYKHKPTPNLKYQVLAIKKFARARQLEKLWKLSSLEKRFGNLRLGLDLEKAIPSLGTGAKRQLIF